MILPVDESVLRSIAFALVFVMMALLQWFFPKRRLECSIAARWFTNISIGVIAALCLRIFLPILAVGMAQLVDERGWGLLHIAPLPMWLKFIIAIVLLDMLIYWQHVASHKFRFLWAFHKVHHCDRDLDVTTGIRFHPVEIILSMAYKILCVMALGASPYAVITFELLLNACSLFNHTNLNIPARLEHFLRYFIVTPDMHRIHHSTISGETNSNYGFSMSFWDRLFLSYVEYPKFGHKNMCIGLSEYQGKGPTSLGWSMLLPFHKK